MTIPYDDTIHFPLSTAEAILERTESLVGPACREQTWFLFLDADDVQLPLLIPVDQVPAAADDDLEQGARDVLGSLWRATDAAAIIAVIERPCTTSLHPDDRAWAQALHSAAVDEGIDLRAVLLSHDHGVRALGPDDLM
jgi:hypothetical protein